MNGTRGRAPHRILTRREPADLRVGGGRSPAALPTTPLLGGRVAARHTVQTSTAAYTLVLNGPTWMGRRGVSEALAAAVAELRAVDVTYGPLVPGSLVSRLRRGEITAEAYPPLADLVARCTAMRAATDGWFDAWAAPGGFDPGGLIKGWAIEQAAARLRAAGVKDYAVVAGADLVVNGRAPHGGPWRVAVHHPTHAATPPVRLELTRGAIGTSGVGGRRGHVIDPHTGRPVDHTHTVTVIGPDLTTADAYATALFAVGPVDVGWFPRDGYRTLSTFR
ncbi:MAG TPA: FAD:protein FMN transferase [Micromonosporaceae bacterium]